MSSHNKSHLCRTYRVESCQNVIDDQWKPTRTPGFCPGAELPFEFLLEKK